MSFIKPLPRHWTPRDFDLADVLVDEPVRHIARTVCLLESRCDDYADYLRAILRDREPAWNAAIDQWNSEECQHGELLRLLSEAADPGFDFDTLMSRYESLVSYHAPTGKSVRGSVGAEMVSRCVVEALASTLYRVLADAVDERCRPVFAALAQDEARHFGMFLKMLNTEAATVRGLGFVGRCRHAIRRMLELEDAQITMASCVVAGQSETAIQLRREADWYLGRLYGLYRWRHLRYAVQMLLPTVGVKPTRTLAAVCASALWVGVKLRWVWARCFSRRTWSVKTPNGKPG